MVSTCRKKRLTIRKRFHSLSPTYRMKDSFKITFPLDKRYLSLARVSEKWEKLTSAGQKISFHEQK